MLDCENEQKTEKGGAGIAQLLGMEGHIDLGQAMDYRERGEEGGHSQVGALARQASSVELHGLSPGRAFGASQVSLGRCSPSRWP